jgi:hypothetical protein
MKNSVHETSTLHSNKNTSFESMKDQLNGNTEKRCPPLHLTVHEVYEMVKGVHVVLGNWKRTVNNTEQDDMWKKQSIF